LHEWFVATVVLFMKDVWFVDASWQENVAFMQRFPNANSVATSGGSSDRAKHCGGSDVDVCSFLSALASTEVDSSFVCCCMPFGWQQRL